MEQLAKKRLAHEFLGENGEVELMPDQQNWMTQLAGMRGPIQKKVRRSTAAKK